MAVLLETMGWNFSYTYTGREWDKETGLYYYRARYYDPMEGRFISKDPLGSAGGINLYAYVRNNSINLTDPLGLRPLNDKEKNVLSPYIPKVDLDAADLHDGEVPFYLPSNMDGITRGNDIYFRKDVYDANTPEGIAVLGHELVHVGQYRNGTTLFDFLWSYRNGYSRDTEYEKPAYELGDRINFDLSKRGYPCSR